MSISVIMPVFNCAEYVEKAIDSIFAQTFKDFKLIIIDDGSTDDTWEVVTSHPQYGKFFIEGIPHAGVAAALNRGVCLARGDYIARHDGDDWSHPLRFERQVEYLETHSECRAVGTGMLLIDNDGVPFKMLEHPIAINKAGLLDDWPCVSHPTMMIRANVFQDVGAYDEDMDYCEDYDLWLKIVEHYGGWPIHNISDMLYIYRQHDQTKTSKGKRNGLLELYDEMVLLKAKIRKAKNET